MIKNAKIHAVTCGTDKNLPFMMGMWIELRYDSSSGQSFGGFNLGSCDELHPKTGLLGSHFGHFVCRMLQIAEVNDVKQLVGRPVRARISDDDRIEALGHFLNDDWFCPKEDFAHARTYLGCGKEGGE